MERADSREIGGHEQLYEMEYQKGGTKVTAGVEVAKEQLKEQQNIDKIPTANLLVSDAVFLYQCLYFDGKVNIH